MEVTGPSMYESTYEEWKAMRTEYVDLVLDNGELVRIECPEKFGDQLHDTLENAMKRREWWRGVGVDWPRRCRLINSVRTRCTFA